MSCLLLDIAMGNPKVAEKSQNKTKASKRNKQSNHNFPSLSYKISEILTLKWEKAASNLIKSLLEHLCLHTP